MTPDERKNVFVSHTDLEGNGTVAWYVARLAAAVMKSEWT